MNQSGVLGMLTEESKLRLLLFSSNDVLAHSVDFENALANRVRWP
jgi:hypothetical protein